MEKICQLYAKYNIMALHPQYSTVKTTPLHAQGDLKAYAFFCYFIKALLQLLCARVHHLHLRFEVNANICMKKIKVGWLALC